MRFQCYFIILLVAVCMGATLVVNGQFSAVETIRHGTASKHFIQIQTADLDGDSQDEVLGVRSKELRYFSFLNGQIDSEHLLYSSNSEILFYTTVDVDNDGDVDILVHLRSQTMNTLVLLENNNGIFSSLQIWQGNSEFRKILTADLNGDGFNEIMAFTGTEATILSGIGNQGYSTIATLDFYNNDAHFFSDAILKDMDADGHIDLVLLKTGMVVSFRNIGDLIFEIDEGTHMLNHIFDPANNFLSEQAVRMRVADLNADGVEEFVVLTKQDISDELQHCDNRAANRFYVFSKNSEGYINSEKFTSQANAPARFYGNPHDLFFVEDIDGDGLADIVSHSYHWCYKHWNSPYLSHIENKILLNIQNQNGGFSESILGSGLNSYTLVGMEQPAWSHFQARDVAFGDINGNGHKEIIVAPWDERLFIGTAPFAYFTKINGNTGANYQYIPLEADLRTTALTAGDFDGNGKATLVQTCIQNGQHGIIEYHRTAPLNYEQSYATTPENITDKYIIKTITGDINGNGLDDLAYVLRTISQNQFSIQVAFSDGVGGWSEPLEAELSTMPIDIAFGDMQGDGKEELIVGIRNQENYQLRILTWANNSLTPLAQTENFQGFAVDMRIGDLDMNSYPDISILEDDGTLRLLMNTGTATFEVIEIQPNLEGSANMSHLYTDLNGDGLLDLVTWSTQASTPLIWHMNVGGGNFAAAQILIDAEGYDQFVEIGNIYGTASSQIFTLSGTGQLLMIQLEDGTGAGVITELYNIGTKNRKIHLAAADFTGNGVDDIAVSIYKNATSLSSDATLLMGIANTPNKTGIAGMIFIDENGNGIMDEAEIPASGVRIKSLNSAGFTFSNSDGKFELEGIGPGDHELLADVDTYSWQITTSAEELLTTLNAENGFLITDVMIGIQPSNPLEQLELVLTSAQIPCEGPAKQWIYVVNRSNFKFGGGKVNLALPASLELSNQLPVAVNTDESIYEFSIPEIEATHHVLIPLESLGYEIMTEGEVVKFKANLSNVQGNEIDNVEYEIAVSCKQMSHSVRAEQGWTKHGFVLAGDSLEFTLLIEKNNENNQTVSDVFGAIPQGLKAESLLPIGWSREPKISVSSSGVLHLKFDHDTASNQTVDFVRFRCAQNDGLPNGTTVFQGMNLRHLNGEIFVCSPALNTIFVCEGLAEFEIDMSPPLCEGMNIQAKSVLPLIHEYQWSDGDELLSTEADLPSFYLNEGLNTIYLKVSNPLCKEESYTELNVDAFPEVPVIFQLDGKLFVDDIFASYQWYLNEMPIEDADKALLIPTESGQYFLEVTSEQGCTTKSKVQTYDSNWSTFSKDDAITIFPNPAVHSFYVACLIGLSENATLWVSDMSGRLLHSQALNENGLTVINSNVLAEGIYILQIKEGNDVVATRKQVIAR